MSEKDNLNQSAVTLYQTEDGRSRILVHLENETVWLTQAMMAELYQTSPQNITLHIKAIYEDAELSESATCKQFLQVRKEGIRSIVRNLKHYNLDMILAVGYRVRSERGILFRQWATERLREYIVKGFTLDDERLKGRDRLADYFDELLARIREIRASEARVYQRIREIFAMAVDYRDEEQATQTFFAIMQNKMHYAATGLTAPEIVRNRSNAELPNMGLTSWKGGRVLKADVGTAKNYLSAQEIDTLNRITVMFLDQAEFRAQRRSNIHLHDWEVFLDKFLRDTELPVLSGSGSISHDAAKVWAGEQYDDFAERRRLEAEQKAGEKYLEDLKNSAKRLEAGRTVTPGEKKPKNVAKSASKKGKR